MHTPIPSLWGLFLQADWVVKSVIMTLILASVWSWSIIFSKISLLKSLKKSADFVIAQGVDFHHKPFRHQDILEDEPFSMFLEMASLEMRKQTLPIPSKQRDWLVFKFGQMFSLKIDEWREILSSQIGVLASIGSMAPFIGLFGTVWGIMNSFQSIAASKNTSLAVVGPGIAEALFATAIGLLVAIPAVIAYNKLSLSIQSYLIRLENFSQEIILKFFSMPEEK